MKKTLFLSAILGAALCSSAFGAVSTQTLSSATVTIGDVTVPAQAGTVNLVTTTSSNQEQTDLPSGLGEAAVTVLGGANARFKINDASRLSGCGTVVLGTASVSGQEGTVNGGQLFIDAWDTSGVTIANALVFGETGYSEGDTYSTALRMHEARTASKKIVLSGPVTIAADTKFSIGFDYNYIEGNISGAGKTLTLKENNSGKLHLSGGATLGTLDAGAVQLFMDATKADGETAADGKTYNIGTLTTSQNLTMGDGVQLNLTSGTSTVKSVSGGNAVNIGEGATLKVTAQSVATLNLQGAGNAEVTYASTGTDKVINANNGLGTLSVSAAITTGHDTSVSVQNFSGTLELTGRFRNMASFGNATKLVLHGSRGGDNTTGFWGTGAKTFALPVEIDGEEFVDFFASAEYTFSNTVSGNKMRTKNGSNVTFNGAVTLANFTDTDNDVFFNADTVIDEVVNTSDKTITFAANKTHRIGTISGTGAVTLNGNVAIVKEDATTEKLALTSGNGFGSVKTSATVVTGTNNVTNNAAWTLNGTEATFENGGVSYVTAGASDIYYINNAGASADITKDATLVSNLGEATFSEFFNIRSGKTLTITDGLAFNMVAANGAANMGFWMENGSSIEVNNGASLTTYGLTFTDAVITSSGNAQLGDHGNSESSRHLITINGSVSVNSGVSLLRDYTFGDAAVTVNSGTMTTISSALSADTDLIVNAGSGVTFSKDSTVASLSGDGSVALGQTLTVKGNAEIGTLTLNSGAVIDTTDHSGTLTTSTLTVNSDAAINANLVVKDHGTLDFSSGHTLTLGCTVTIGDEVTVIICDEVMEYIHRGEAMTIMYGVDNETLESITLGNVHFIMNGAERPDFFFVTEEDTVNGGMKLMVAPEPATATLSLLALAALAARRKRH